jgi:hypothetical protein
MERDVSRFLPLSPATLHVMLALINGDLHGYGIMLEVTRQSGGRYKIGPGALYDNVKSLLKVGFIEEHTAPDSETPSRRRYHLSEFRNEFGSEMTLDSEDAFETHGFAALLRDALLSLVRQWVALAFPGEVEICASPGGALLAGQYVMIQAGGLSPLEFLRGLTLSVMLFSAMGIVTTPANGAIIHLKLNHKAVSGKTLPHAVDVAVPREIRIIDITIIDVRRGILEPHRTVVIREGLISGIVAAQTSKEAPGVDDLDGRGKFLIPAQWDMHTHITTPERDFPMYIANGVLGLRNMGGVREKVYQWKRDTSNGTLFGPRIFVSGPIVDGPGGPAPENYAVRVANAAEGRREVDSLKTEGADTVKVYDGLSPEAYFSIAKEAEKAGLSFAGHVPTHVTILEATNAGQRSIEHAIELRGGSTAERELIENDLRRKEPLLAEAMRTQNFSLIPETIAHDGGVLLDHLSQPKADSLYRAFVKNGTYLCPTLDVKEWLAYADDLAKRDDPREQYVPHATLHNWRPEVNMLTRYRTPAYIAFRKREYAAIRAQIPKEQAAGVQLLAGTDLTVPFTYAGFSVHEEMALLVKAGLTPLQALQSATTHPVEFLHLQTTMGSVTAGKRAELVILDDNPLADIHNTAKITAVVTHGRLLRRTELDVLLKQAAESAQNAN